MVNRPVIGAGYGMKDWVMQRVTAVLMVIYTLMLLGFLLLAPQTYDSWQVLFAQTWVRVFTLITLVALALHAWVGVRDLWMDYLTNHYLRLVMHVFTIVWLLGTFTYAIKVLWGL